MSSVRDLREDEIPQATSIIARAFARDPALSFLLPDPSDRLRTGTRMVASWIRYCRGWGAAWCTDGLEGVALRRPPGSPGLHPWGVVASGMVWAPLWLGLAATVRLVRAAVETGRRHATAVRRPHWYLWMIAVAPEAQGHGHGGALMAHTFERADREGVPCFLETTSPRALDIHAAHGFEVAAEGLVPGTDLQVWSMVRPARKRLVMAT